MKKLTLAFILLVLFGLRLEAQQTSIAADCVISVTLTAAGRVPSSGFDNRRTACTTWHLVYENDGFSALSIRLDNAPDSSNAPGSWVVWPAASLASGTLPLTSTTNSQITAYKYFPWVSVNVTSVTGTGTIRAVAYGFKPGLATSDSNGTAGLSIVGNLTANNAAPAGNNAGVLSAVATAAQQSYTAGNQVLQSVDLNGNQRVRIQDAAGNDRGANVTAANEEVVGGSGSAGTASAAVVTIQGIAGMTKLLVTPDALPANQSVNVAQWGGTALGTPTNFGTTPGAVIAGSVNASLFQGTTAILNGGTAGGLGVGGLAAAGVGVAGNPVWVGMTGSGGAARALTAEGNIADAGNGDGILATGYGIFNGTNWDRGRSAALANFPLSTTLTARNSIGATITEKGSRWAVVSNPGAGSQATASIAAEASVRHVADCVSFSAAATVAPALTALTVNLRDGATGAGTVIWTQQVVAPAATGQAVTPFSFCGLNLVGTTNTAMTLEFSAALANLIEATSISGYNTN